MIVYSVTTNIDLSVQDEWLQWMKTIHIPEVMKTGIFTEYRLMRVLGDADSGGATYSVQYLCESMGKFHLYEQQYAHALRQQAMTKYGDKFIAFRTLLEMIS